MPPLFLVMIGGAIGAGLRYQVSRIAFHLAGPGFPWGTWAVNLLGGFLMGALAGTLAREVDGGEHLRLLLGVGVLGGFTTFSAFSLETFNMLQRGDHALAASYALSSVAGSVLMLACGVYATRLLP
jgi:CrcB protein